MTENEQNPAISIRDLLQQAEDEVGDVFSEDLPDPPGDDDPYAEVRARTDKQVGGRRQTNLVEGMEEPEELVSTMDDLKAEIRRLEVAVSGELSKTPSLRLALRCLDRLVLEYDRVDTEITSFKISIRTSTATLSGRIRDNMTTLIVERWRLLSAISDNIHKLHTALSKTNKVTDPFDEFLSGDINAE